MAALIVVFPVFLWISRVLERDVERDQKKYIFDRADGFLLYPNTAPATTKMEMTSK